MKRRTFITLLSDALILFSGVVVPSILILGSGATVRLTEGTAITLD